MDIAKAKLFICHDAFLDKIYMSKDIQTLFDNVDVARKYIGLFCVVDTEGGETVFEVDQSYDYEPVIMHRHMHFDTFLKFNNDCEIIKL
jgi:hypothetical protein